MSDISHPETHAGAAQTQHPETEELKRTVQRAKETAIADAREGISQGTAKVKEEAAARAESAKQDLAQELSATAEALGFAARELEGHSLQRSLLSQASEGLTSISRAIEGRSVGDIVSDLAGFGRRNPVAFLGGATLAGFALARLAQASAPDSGTGSAEGGDWPDRRYQEPEGASVPKPGTVGSADAETLGGSDPETGAADLREEEPCDERHS